MQINQLVWPNYESWPVIVAWDTGQIIEMKFTDQFTPIINAYLIISLIFSWHRTNELSSRIACTLSHAHSTANETMKYFTISQTKQQLLFVVVFYFAEWVISRNAIYCGLFSGNAVPAQARIISSKEVSRLCKKKQFYFVISLFILCRFFHCHYCYYNRKCEHTMPKWLSCIFDIIQAAFTPPSQWNVAWQSYLNQAHVPFVTKCDFRAQKPIYCP